MAYQPGSEPARLVCANCYQPLPHHVAPPIPSFDDYMTAAHNLAAVVRQAFSDGAKRSEILTALEAFERLDQTSERSTE